YHHHTAAGVRLDRMSARDWIERNVPGGVQSKLGWLLDLDLTTENGGDASVQSALELIFMLGYMSSKTGRDQFYLVGTDERYHVVGGNDQIARALASRLPSASIRTSTALEALRRRPDGSYVCTVSSQLRTFEMTADHVVLALPFSTLRLVDLSRAGFRPLKMRAIEKLPMGTNTKLQVQFRERLWYKQHYNGYTYADTGLQQTWESSRAQPGRSGLLTDYLGGTIGASFHAPSFGPASNEVVRRFLFQLEPIYPGITRGWNGKAYLDFWTADPWHRGSYSYTGVGQFTSFVGIEPEREGNVHFCGEHTSIEFAGFMNGAVDSGEKAAAQILADLGLRTAAAKAAS
ncbi:MAG: FAD-dependent oxidoreductase, partial [Candidatus Eremiobacteraeota bacterium]|nr:FAD-dependent oxidoreductase [Candidatus Eremiobacteraeota bacterium]